MNRDNLTGILSALGMRVHSENRSSQFLNCQCPFAGALHRHGTDRSASFGARYDDRRISAFTCHACKQHGSIYKLVTRLAALRGVDYSDLLKRVDLAEAGLMAAQGAPFDRPYEEPVEELRPLNAALYEGLYPDAWEVEPARAYLQGRGISEDTTYNLGLVYRDTYPIIREDGTEGQWFRGDILFPVRDRDGAFYGFTGRTTRDAFGIKPKVYDKDLPKRHLILGEERWITGRPTMIVEGLFGYAHLINIGAEDFANVGAIMGSVMTPEKAQRLKDWGNAVCLALDNDEAGDFALFGPLDEEGRRDESRSAVHALVSALVVMVPGWPLDATGRPKEDPDQLSYEEARSMVFETAPVTVPRKKSFAKKTLTNTLTHGTKRL